MNFIRDFVEQAERRPEAPAIIHEGRTYSYGELMEQIDRCGRALKEAGVKPGDRVALMMNNRPEFAVAYNATVKIGAIIVPINTFLKGRELEGQINGIEPKVFIGNDWAALSVGEVRDRLTTVRQFVFTDNIKGEMGFDEFLSSTAGALPLYQAEGDDVAVIKFTAGTTGRAKGAMQTHDNVYRFLRTNMDIYPIEQEHCILLFVPLFHGFGDHCCMNPVLMCGASMVLMDPFKPLAIFEAIQDYRCTYFGATPSMLYGLMHHSAAGDYDLSSLRRVLTGGGPVSREIVEGFGKKFDVDVLQGYGLTEGTAGYTYTRVDMPFREGSCGVALPGVEIRIEDDKGNALPPGQVGEIVVRSPFNMKGYWRNPQATAEAIREGWLYTGDLGKLDEEGYLYIVDRKKDLIIMSGENIYPAEVEDVLLTHPAVAEAAVIGAPDPRRGEVPCAIVVPRPGHSPTEEEIIDFCKERMASFKVPRMVYFRSSMPKSAVFKVLRRELRRELFGSEK
jgi:long-chain acyl-CoA synthetase